MKDIDYNKYKNIINLKHHVSKKHPQMSLEARSAQFAPYATLTGYGDAINETKRLTFEKIQIDEQIQADINITINSIKEKIKTEPRVKIKYFVDDSKKKGGNYVTVEENVNKIDEYEHTIILKNKQKIDIDEIIKIEQIK